MFNHTKVCQGLILAFGSVLATSAIAQEQANVQRVEITGSAIKRLDAETAVPVTVLKADEIKAQGITTIEQVMQVLSSMQTSTTTSQVVGSGSAGSSFANLRGVGANKTLVLLNGRRLANNAFDSSAPDLNMIPFAALDRVEVLRDGAGALYGTDAIGGVINFITKSDFTGGGVSISASQPKRKGGDSSGANIALGVGDLVKDKVNLFAVLDFSQNGRIGGTQRNYNTRVDGGLSPTPFPANYYQGGDSGNPAATNPDCAGYGNLISDGGTGCYISTSKFVNYTPAVDRVSGLLKATFDLSAQHRLSFEYFSSQTRTDSVIAPVPYGGLYMNRLRPDGSLNPFYPGNPGSSVATPNIPLDPNYTESASTMTRNSLQPGFIHVKWRDLPNGSREDIATNTQDRFVASLQGQLGDWDYNGAISINNNNVRDDLKGYSNGALITAGVRNGIINPFGDQTAAGLSYILGAALDGNLQNAHGKVSAFDLRGSREIGDWFGAGQAGLAVGVEARREKFLQAANYDYASKVVASTGIDPNTLNAGDRDVYAAYTELNVPVMKTLDLTFGLRHDKYSDFGSTTNPKLAFRFQPVKSFLARGSVGTGFRAPSLYELNAAQAYTNTTKQDDPINCPGGTPIDGKPRAANCGQQFQALTGGNQDLKPEKSRNWTLGFLVEPVSDLTLAADFWGIQLRQLVGSLSTDTVFSEAAKYAALYHRNPAGNLSTDGSACPGDECGYVDLRTRNLGGVITNGVDLEVKYRFNVASIGKFNATLQSTLVHKYAYQNDVGTEYINNLGVYSGGSPVFRWQHNVGLNWAEGDYSAGATVHYKSGYVDADPENKVKAYITTDIYGSANFAKHFGLTVGVRNLLDRTPPFSNQTTVFQAGYDPRYTDPTGRAFYARGSYTF